MSPEVDRLIPVTDKTLADLNRINREFWLAQSARFEKLLRERGTQATTQEIVKNAAMTPDRKSFESEDDFWEAFRSTLPMETVVLETHDQLVNSGFYDTKTKNACNPRYQTPSGFSHRELVKEYGLSTPEPTKVIWPGFLDFLRAKGLNPRVKDDGNTYVFDGKNKPIEITLLQFGKLISELVPRRAVRPKRPKK